MTDTRTHHTPDHRSTRPTPTGPWDVVVVGSGIAGLTAAAAARRAGARVALLEGPTPSGRARTDERDGFRLNLGPHALYSGGVGQRVLTRFGIEPEGAPPPGRGVLAWDDRTATLPVGWRTLVSRFLGPVDKARLGTALRRVGRTDPADVAHVSARSWLDGLLPPAPRAVLGALVRVGTYGSELDRLSADVAVTQLQASAGGVTYLHDGWAQLTTALGAAAPGVDVVHGAARRVEPTPDGARVVIDSGSLDATRVVLAVGSPAATAALLPDGAPAGWSALGPAVTASCLDLALRTPPPVPTWFGVDRPHYLVAHAPSARLAPDGRSLVHVMRNLPAEGAAGHEELRAELWALARRAGITEDDVVFERYLHRMVVVSASVGPDAGGLRGRPAVDDSGAPGVLVAGDWVGPDGWLADASLASGDAAGRAAADASRRHRSLTPSRVVG